MKASGAAERGARRVRGDAQEILAGRNDNVPRDRGNQAEASWAIARQTSSSAPDSTRGQGFYRLKLNESSRMTGKTARRAWSDRRIPALRTVMASVSLSASRTSSVRRRPARGPKVDSVTVRKIARIGKTQVPG